MPASTRLARALAQSRADRERLDGDAIGLPALILLGISVVVGTGILVTTGVAASQYAGPAVTISFAIAGFVTLLTAFAFAELAAMIPSAGSTYTYAQVAFGPLIGWLTGWARLAGLLFGVAGVAVGWSAYSDDLLATMGVALPTMVTHGPFDRPSGVVNLPAVAVIAVIGMLLYSGTRQSTRANAVFVAIKVGILLLVVIAGALAVDPANWSPFIPADMGTFGMYGWSGVLRAAGVVIIAYLGFDTITSAASETRDPQRNVPRALLIVVLTAIVLYVSVAFVVTGLVGYMQLDVADPLAVALAAIGDSGVLVRLLDVGAVIGLAGGMLVGLYSLTRMVLRMADDGGLPRRLGAVGARRTPGAATLISVMLIAILAATVPLQHLFEFVATGTLATFVVAIAAVLRLRVTDPSAERPFRIPAVWIIAPLALASTLALLALLPWRSWASFGVWLLIGLALHAAFARRTARAA